MAIPQTLYYATVYYANGSWQTPMYFVFEKLPQGVSMVRRYLQDREQDVEEVVIKELDFLEHTILPEEASILLPHNDNAIVEEPYEEIQHAMVENAEEGDPSESIMVVFPEEQEGNDLLCRAFYMGPFFKAASPQELINKLVDDPFISASPVDYVWLYRPTGVARSIKL